MPRCLMAKKWKAYPWPNRDGGDEDAAAAVASAGNDEEDEEIDVVGDANESDPTPRGWAPVGAVPAPSTWGPSSPTAGATAPSPPPNQSGSTIVDGASRVAVLYSDHVQDPVHYTAYLPQTYHDDGTRRTYTTLQTEIEQQRQSILVAADQSHVASPPVHRWTEKKYQVLSSLENKSEIIQDISGHGIILITPTADHQDKAYPEYAPPDKVVDGQDANKDSAAAAAAATPNKAKKSLSMCYTSTGATLSLPPKKKDIYRPYSLDDRPTVVKPKPRSLAVDDAKQQDVSHPMPRPYETENIGLTVGRMVQVVRDTREQDPAAYCCKTQAPPPTATTTSPQQHPTEYQSRSSESDACKRVDQENYYEERYESGYPREDPYQREERSYQYEDRSFERYSRPAEDISAAHAILDLSASTSILPASVQESNPPTVHHNPERVFKVSTPVNKTVAYTYEAFFVSDGRSKKKPVVADVPSQDGAENKAKYTCSECGKQYATSSNLSRHKQTHRSLDSQSAKKCMTCGKAYVSMPALAMHLLTHKLSHGCGVCGKLFSRPWLLQGHLRSHTGEKPYGCAHCGKAFADRSNLRAHMQTHSIDKNYVCMRCNKSFALKSYLNKHLESACFKDNTNKDGDGTGSSINTNNTASTSSSSSSSSSTTSPSSSGVEVSPLTPPQSPSPLYGYSL